MTYSLRKLLKGGYIGNYIGDYFRGYSGDTRSFHFSSHDLEGFFRKAETRGSTALVSESTLNQTIRYPSASRAQFLFEGSWAPWEEQYAIGLGT